MSKLLHIAQQEVKKVQTKHEEINGTEKLDIYLDWGRNGEERLELLSSVNVPKHIIRTMRAKRSEKNY